MKVKNYDSPRVYIVDDSAPYRILLDKLLQHNGYQTMLFQEAKDVVQALDNDELPALILSDIQMPDMDGFQLWEVIQNEYPHLDIPFIYISSTTSDKKERRARSLSSNPMLSKPVKAEELLDSLNDVIPNEKVA